MTERDNEFGHACRANARPVSPCIALCALWIATSCDRSDPPTPTPTAPPPPVEPSSPAADGNVVVIGSGTPIADPDRRGPATAILVGDRTFLLDAGAGVLRGLAAAGRDPASVEHVFLTHLHSDHVLGLDEMMLGAWTVGRDRPLHVHGPPGIAAMVEHLEAAYAEDRAMRTEGLERASPEGARVVVRTIEEPGEVFGEDGLRVRAFSVAHGAWEHAFGYRVEVGDRVVVISGDTAPSDGVVEACDGCDLLVHEAYSAAGWRAGPEGWRDYHAAFHTSGEQLGQLAARARPQRLVVTHLLFFGQPPASLLEEVRAGFDGDVVLAEDGGRY